MRTAEQILQGVKDGELQDSEIHIRETARLTVVDVETGTVEERIISDAARTLVHEQGQFQIR